MHYCHAGMSMSVQPLGPKVVGIAAVAGIRVSEELLSAHAGLHTGRSRGTLGYYPSRRWDVTMLLA